MFRPLTLSLVLALVGPSVHAANGDNLAAQEKARTAEIAKELNLSDQQIEQIEPILKRRHEQQADVLNQFGLQPDSPNKNSTLSFRERRKLRADLIAVRQGTIEELTHVLSDEQLQQYNAIAEERRVEIRSKIKERRSNG